MKPSDWLKSFKSTNQITYLIQKFKLKLWSWQLIDPKCSYGSSISTSQFCFSYNVTHSLFAWTPLPPLLHPLLSCHYARNYTMLDENPRLCSIEYCTTSYFRCLPETHDFSRMNNSGMFVALYELKWNSCYQIQTGRWDWRRRYVRFIVLILICIFSIGVNKLSLS